MGFAPFESTKMDQIEKLCRTLHTLARSASVPEAMQSARGAAPERFETHIAVTETGPIALWCGDAGWETIDADAPGARHRLALVRGVWCYERSRPPS